MLRTGLLVGCLVIAGLVLFTSSDRREDGAWVARCATGSAEATTVVVTRRNGAWYDTASGKLVVLPEESCVFSEE